MVSLPERLNDLHLRSLQSLDVTGQDLAWDASAEDQYLFSTQNGSVSGTFRTAVFQMMVGTSTSTCDNFWPFLPGPLLRVQYVRALEDIFFTIFSIAVTVRIPTTVNANRFTVLQQCCGVTGPWERCLTTNGGIRPPPGTARIRAVVDSLRRAVGWNRHHFQDMDRVEALTVIVPAKENNLVRSD
jgi:hypothetical protein